MCLHVCKHTHATYICENCCSEMLLDAPLQSQGGPHRVPGPPGRVTGVRGGLAHLCPRQLPHQLQEPGGSSGLPGGAATHAAGPRGLPGRHYAHAKGEFRGALAV